jgi:hypothetical protein
LAKTSWTLQLDFQTVLLGGGGVFFNESLQNKAKYYFIMTMINLNNQHPSMLAADGGRGIERQMSSSVIFLNAIIIGAEQSASGAPHFRVPSSEFRAPRWQTSEFREKKKERQTEGGKHPSQRVANIRVPRKEERKKERKRVANIRVRGWQTSEFRVPRKEERKKDRKKEGGKHPSKEERKTEGGKHPSSEGGKHPSSE